MSKIMPTGAGSRPTTDGAADNIGAGSGFDPKNPNVDRPAPHERMAEKRADAASVAQDASAPFGLRESGEASRPDDPSQAPRGTNRN